MSTQLDSKQAIQAAFDDPSQALKVFSVGGQLIPAKYDFIALTYVAAGNGAGEIQTVTYKTGGAGGSTVAVLTLGYDGANHLVSVTKA